MSSICWLFKSQRVAQILMVPWRNRRSCQCQRRCLRTIELIITLLKMMIVMVYLWDVSLHPRGLVCQDDNAGSHLQRVFWWPFQDKKRLVSKLTHFPMPAHLLLSLHQLPHHGQQHCFELVPHEAVDEEVCRRIHNQEQVHETAESRLMRIKNGKHAPGQAKEPTRRHEAITPVIFLHKGQNFVCRGILTFWCSWSRGTLYSLWSTWKYHHGHPCKDYLR